MEQKERLEEAGVAAWIAAIALVEYAMVLTDNFGVHQGEPEAKDYAEAAKSLRTRLRRMIFLTLDAMIACARVEFLAENQVE